MYVSSTRQESVVGFKWGTISPLQFRRVVLHPPINGRVINIQPSFSHHLFQITIAQRRAQIPSDAQENDIRLEMAPFKRILAIHDGNLSRSFLFTLADQLSF